MVFLIGLKINKKYEIMSRKIILHLCADLGSDSKFYQMDDDYDVVKIGIEIGVENYTPPKNVYGVIANPVCTEFSTVGGFDKVGDLEKGMYLVNHCKRIIDECNPKFWAIENPANGRLKECIGKPDLVYQPWQYGSPWTKKTALWGNFNKPKQIYFNWEDVPKNENLYIRPGRGKPSLALFHKSAVNLISEFQWAKSHIKCDTDIRSMCSQGFAKAFYEANL
tara:strand:+ start:622 stop:1287 length:666 start_codon:yes stop_codon:yes gene_type:complete